jgi:hypothetical protein
MGLNTGQPVLLDGIYIGVDVNRAARICSAGHGDQVLCSETVYDAVSGGCPFKDLGRYVLAGLPEPERIFQLVMPDARPDFPVLRVAPAKAGVRGARSWRRRRSPSLEDAAWQIRALLPRVSGELRGSLGELGGSLFTAQRAVERSDGFLTRIDRARLAKRLADQREMSGFLERADHEAAALQAQITAVERAAGQQQALIEIAPRVLALLGDHQAVTAADLDPLRERIAADTTRLDAAITTAAAIVDPLSFRLSRTRYRRVYRSGGRYIVPFVDGLGGDRVRDFETLSQAHDFRVATRIAEKAKSDYPGKSPGTPGW